jgi:sugar-specific transcriptional regulator TrmB
MALDLSKKLTELGLSDKEAEIYIALLKFETAAVKELVIETGLNRSTIYVVLEQLKKSGFASISNKRGVRTYTPASPERLMEAVREKTRQNILASETLAALIPELTSIHKSTKFKPQVTVFEGVTGLKKAFEDALINKEKVMRVFSSADDIFRSLPDYLPFFIQERMKRGIIMYGIHPDDSSAREMMKRMPNNPDDLTFIPSDKFTFPSDFAVYDNVVAFMSHQPPYSVKIESKEIAEVAKVLIDLARAEAKNYKQ